MEKSIETKIITQFNLYEMEYKGGKVESDLTLCLLDEKHYRQYKNLIDSCFYEMRKALNIRPFEKHSVSLNELTKLKENTFLLLNGDEIICAVTCSEQNIENVAVDLKYQRQGYGRKLMEFALRYMQKRGDSSIKLTVMKWNKHAIALYESLGFEVTRESILEGVNKKDADGHWTFEFTATKGFNIR